MTPHSPDDPPKPDHGGRTALIAGGAVIMATLALTGLARLTDVRDETPLSAEIAQSRDLRFLDGPSGSVLVIDAKSGATVETLAPGSNGFLRATMRGLVRQRQAKGIGNEPPFRITRYITGHTALSDPSTGASVALDAFGQTNARVFSHLLQGEKS